MRSTTAVFVAVLLIGVTASAPAIVNQATAPPTGSPDELLQRGQDDYRAGRYTQAVTELRSASEAFLTPEQMRTYVNTGKFETLPKFETAIVYLALSYAKLGRDADASEQIHRLTVAEGIEPTYARLPLTADVADFEQVVARVAPATKLPPNAAIASFRGVAPTQVAQKPTRPAPAPPTQVAQKPTRPAPPPPTVIVTPVPATPTPLPTPVIAQTQPAPPPPAGKVPVQPTIPEDRAAQQRIIEERVAAERAAIERDAAQRVAAAQAQAQRTVEERVAAERAAIQRAADEKLAADRKAAEAAAHREADQRVAEARAAADRAADERIAAERAAAQKAADERIAAERAALERQTRDRVAAERAAAERDAAARVAAAEAQSRGNELALLRQADVLATHSSADQADAIYTRLANSSTASRDTIAAAATGLYRVGDFRGAVAAFQRLGTFARGEEDLRYYNAVSLYETGHYDQAKKELACALPYIQVTDDVLRYRAKIEQTAGQQAMR